MKLEGARVKKGDASPEEKDRHLAMRREFARSLAAAQGLGVPDGQDARKHFRVAQVYNLEVNNAYRAVTRDISRSGFSALVPGSFKEGEEVLFSIQPGRGVDGDQEPVRVGTTPKDTPPASIDPVRIPSASPTGRVQEPRASSSGSTPSPNQYSSSRCG